MPMLEGPYRNNNSQEEPTLQQLVETSVPDVKLYDILVLGETGPLSQGREPQIVNVSDFSLAPRRRRSLNDLLERSNGGIPSTVSADAGDAKSDRGSDIRSPLIQGDQTEPVSISSEKTPEVWRRRCLSFRALSSPTAGQISVRAPTDEVLDSEIFSLPHGVGASKPRRSL